MPEGPALADDCRMMRAPPAHPADAARHNALSGSLMQHIGRHQLPYINCAWWHPHRGLPSLPLTGRAQRSADESMKLNAKGSRPARSSLGQQHPLHVRQGPAHRPEKAQNCSLRPGDARSSGHAPVLKTSAHSLHGLCDRLCETPGVLLCPEWH